MQYEDCPICWRHFSLEAAPVCLPCGHSLCAGCSGAVKRCPLCRLKLPASFVSRPNFSLIHVLEKNSENRIQSTDQQTQTEEVKPLANTSANRSSVSTSAFQGKAMNIVFKRGSMSLSIS